jgi:hypothetical protein
LTRQYSDTLNVEQRAIFEVGILQKAVGKSELVDVLKSLQNGGFIGPFFLRNNR